MSGIFRLINGDTVALRDLDVVSSYDSRYRQYSVTLKSGRVIHVGGGGNGFNRVDENHKLLLEAWDDWMNEDVEG